MAVTRIEGGGLHLDVHDNLADLQQRLQLHERHNLPFVTAYALTKSAQDIQAAEYSSMREVFDRPTRFTLNSLFVRGATRQNLRAEVGFKDPGGSVPAWRYLGPQIEGGTRRHKTFERHLIRSGAMKQNEFAVPGSGVPLDAHGNIRGGHIARILSDIGMNPDALSNTTERSRRTRKGRGRGRYFVLRPDWPAVPGFGRLTRDVLPGIYHRRGGSQEIVPVIIFVPGATYRPLLPYFETARRIMQQRFLHHFKEGWSRFVTRSVTRRAA